jgi:hypothetical protein
MKKSLLWILLGLSFLLALTCTAKTQTSWVSRGSTPSEIVKNVTEKANEGATNIQDVKPNKITNEVVGQGPWKKYQISNTFIWLATNANGVAPYLQWIIYIGMVWASILLIWNWFLLVKGEKINESKDNIKYILIWVMLMTWFYAVIAIVTAVINYFFAS